MSVCVRGARQELGGGEAGACSSDTGRNRKPSAAGPGASARGPGTRPGRRAGLPVGEGQEGAHVARRAGASHPQPTLTPIQGQSLPRPCPPNLLCSPPRGTVSLPRPTGALTPTLGPQEEKVFFFFLKRTRRGAVAG